MLDVGGDTDDGDPSPRRIRHATECESFADGVSLWPELVRHVLVDHRDASGDARVGPFLLREHPPTAQRDVHRLQILGRHPANLEQRLLSERRRLILEREEAVVVVSAQRNVVRDRTGQHAGSLIQIRQKAIPEAEPLVRRVVARAGEIHAHREESVGVESGLDVLETQEAANEQRGADEQNE